MARDLIVAQARVPALLGVAVPTVVMAEGRAAARRYLEFFAAAIRNPHTRRAYARAVTDFLAWCEDHGVPSIAAVQPLHVAAWVEMQARTKAAPTAKLRLAALRHLFDWLVIGQVLPTNPAASVRGPQHVVKVGRTAVLEPAEARALLEGIDVSTPIGLRDRALIGLMVYSFARVGSALGMQVEDVFTQGRRLWVRLQEKDGRAHAMPCHHSLEKCLRAYLDGAGIAGDGKGPLFRTIGRGTARLTRTALSQANAYAMIRRRAAAAGIGTRGGQPQLPGDGYHRLAQSRRHAGERCCYGEPRQHAHYATLRPAAGRHQPGRGGAHTALIAPARANGAAWSASASHDAQCPTQR